MEHISQELLNLEQQLRSFVPQGPQASPEQLLYQAGWEAALAQHNPASTATAPGPVQKSPRPRTNHYWAAACVALLLLSTALGWQVWQQPQPRSLPLTTTTVPTTPQPSPKPAPVLVSTVPENEPETPRSAANEPSALASYLELRQRVTRGGLSMWPVSTPVRIDPNDALPTPARDWQAELLREIL